MKTLISAVCLVLIMLFALPVTAIEEGVYRYPVTPGTDAWFALGSTQARVKALQIPGETLANMSTQTLAQACLDYPFLGEVWFAGKSPQEALDILADSFNGFGELFNRQDAGAELVKIYKQLAPGKPGDHWTLQQKGKYSLRLGCVELLLAQPPVLEHLRADRSLLQNAAACLKTKKGIPGVYGNTTKLATALLMGRLMQKGRAAHKVFNQKVSELTELHDFLKSGTTPHVQVIMDEITAEAEQVLLHNE